MTVTVSPNAIVEAIPVPTGVPPVKRSIVHPPGAARIFCLVIASAMIVGISACAARPVGDNNNNTTVVRGVEQVAVWNMKALSGSAAAAALREALARQVPKIIVLPPQSQAAVVARTAHVIETSGMVIDQPQLLLAVDRNPAIQEIHLVLARPAGERWEVIGSAHVSTGKPGRREHFKTPIGVFLNDASILGYRAQGTYNENHVRGLGVHGMRVWDFGWQTTENWRTAGTTTQIRLEMHATDPDVLEPRIGRPDSEGCVRVPTALNRFLDHYGVIDADLERAAATDLRFRALLPADREPTAIAGHALVVYDSSLN
jgi:hypothetical protein